MNILYECLGCGKSLPKEEVVEVKHHSSGRVFFACSDCLAQAEFMARMAMLAESMGWSTDE